MKMETKVKSEYSPLYFLSALGSGGLSVSFFMYLQFMVPHKDMPMVTFDHIMKVLEKGGTQAVLVLVSILLMLILGVNHFRLLAKNLSWLKKYKQSSEFKAFNESPKGMSMMAIPLTLAMSLNVVFVLGALLIPNLWNNIEYLFPVSITGFLAVGTYASVIFGRQMLRIITTGNSEFVNVNNLSHLISIFTFTMVAVGFAASGAMSQYLIVNSIGIFFAVFFLSMAVVISAVKLILGFRAMMENGIAKEAAPTFWLVIPILTLGGITVIRLLMGLDHHFESHLNKPMLFVISAIIVSLQILNGVFGWAIMKKIGYFEEFVNSDKKSVGSLSLICPGVAFFVFGMFFIHFGLVQNGIIEKFGIMYFIVMLPFVAVQALTIATFLKLSKKLIRKAEFNF